MRMGIVALVLLWVGLPSLGLSKPVEGESQLAQIKSRLMQSSRLRIPFIANEGQIREKRVSYYAQTFGATLYVTQNGEMTYAFFLRKPGQDKPTGLVLKEFLKDAAKISPAGVDRAQTKVNYFKGNDPSKWKTNIATYNELDLGEVYPGIDLKLRAYGNNVEKIFTVKPGASPDTIRLKIEGALSLKVDATGELAAHTALGPVRFSKPIAYQEIKGKKAFVQAAYEVQKETYGFRVGNYDHRFPLIIDPDLVASTFLGGSGYSSMGDRGHDVTLDSSDNVYVTGYTYSSDFPTISGAYDTSINDGTEGVSDVFVSKLNSGLTTLSASTYLGGTSGEEGNSIILDNSGNVYVTGYTESSDYPITSGAYDTVHNSGKDVFVSKLNSSLSTLSASTLIGGGGNDRGNSIRIDASGNVYVTGRTYKPSSGDDYPTTSGAYNTRYTAQSSSYHDVFVSKLDSGLSTLSASTLIGGDQYDEGESIRLDRAGAYVYVTGYTYKGTSTDYPTTSGAYDTEHNNSSSGADVFVSKLDSGLSTLSASTFIGGDASDYGQSLALDTSSNVYVTGYTGNGTTDYPTTSGAYDTEHNNPTSGDDVFVSKLDSGLSTLSASTFIGGSDTDHAYSIVLDLSNYVIVTGYANKASTDYPTTSDAYDTTHNNSSSGPDVIGSELNSDLSSLTYSTFVGGTSSEYGKSVAVDSANANVFGTGYTWSTESDNFPVTSGAYDTTHNGQVDVFIVKFRNGTEGNSAPSTPTAVSPSDQAQVSGGPVSLEASTFSDPESNSHVSTSWRVREAGGPFGKSDYDSSFYQNVSSGSLTQHSVSGVASGMKYYWTAGYVDEGSRSASTSSEYSFIVGTSSADSSVSVSSGTTQSQMQMISFVQFPDDDDATAVLGTELGTYDSKYHRIGTYDPDNGSYTEYSSDLHIDPGKAYWFLCRNGLDITVNGVDVSLSQDVEVELDYNATSGNGWNMVAPPNKANYSWGDVQVIVYDSSGGITYGPASVTASASATYIDARLWGYADGSYDSGTTLMEKYKGYWVKAKADNVYLRFRQSVQASLSNPRKIMLAGVYNRTKSWIKKWIIASPEAIADAGDSPPAPMGGLAAATGGGGGGGCFIATAAFGSPLMPHVGILKTFRDQILLTNSPGKRLVNLYYKVSPPMAEFISGHAGVKTVVRLGLVPIVGAAWFVLKVGLLKTFILIALFLTFIGAPVFYRQTKRRPY